MAELMVKDRGLNITDEKRQSALASDLGFAENALRVLQARYLKKDEDGRRTETPEELFRRVAVAVAEAEKNYSSDPRVQSEWEERFYSLMVSRRFMPNSPTLMNAGREMGMLSACFVLPVRDSINEIFDAIKHTALIQKAGGGTGFAFDELRPTGDYINSSGGTTSGPISFWKAFSEATNAIQQGAFRRGANMGMMYIHHPDILKFLHAKEDLTQFTNYNISVKVPDAWMDSFQREPHAPHVVKNPRTGRMYLLPKALVIWEYDIRSLIEIKEGQPLPQGEFYTCTDIWNIIIKNAHRTGEPGVVFMDRINEVNPTPHIGRMEATNPCGEQPLLPYEACNLGSINLAEFVTNAPVVSPARADSSLRPVRNVLAENGSPSGATVDWDGLRDCIHESTRYLDNIIDVNKYPLKEITDVCHANRKIGLGIMGFADALYKLGVAYNSQEGVEWGEKFMQFVDEESHNYSERLAKERGCFPNWKGSTYDTKFKRPMRNATCTTVAPTGTISIIAGCSGGVEPMYSLAFFRNVLRGQAEGKTPMVETNPIFEDTAKAHGFHSEGLMERIATEGTLANCPEVPDDVKRVFVCAHDIAPEWHMQMQAAFQRHCDASISKTINFPESACVEDVDKIYRMAYGLRCKGVTVYRNGCRKHQPMALKSSDKVHEGIAEVAPAVHKPLEPATLPEITSGIRVRQLTPFGNMHINITVDPKTEREMEVFAQLGKGGDLANSDLEAICRMISLWLRSGGGVDHVINQLVSIGSSLQVSTKDGKIMSLGDGLARGLQKYVRAKKDFGLRGLLVGEVDVDALPPATPSKVNGNGNGHGNGNGNGHKVPRTQSALPPGRYDGMQWQQAQFKVRCPDCQGELRFNEGCMTCEACGFSKC